MERSFWVLLMVAAGVVVALSDGVSAVTTTSRAASEELRPTEEEEDSSVPFWGDEHTEVDELDQHNELVLLEAGLDTSEVEDDAADTDTDDDVDADDEDSAEDDVEDDAAVEVEAEQSHHSARSIAFAAEADASASGMADGSTAAPAAAAAASSLVEHSTRVTHRMPLQASTWAALLVEAKGYQSNALRAASRTGMKGGPCAGVIGAHCKHMADMQPTIGSAPQWQEECAKLICNPLCLRYTWDVKITASGGPDGFEDQVNSLGTQHSLGAQFRAHACGKVAGCCEENEDLLNWVELRNFAGMFPESPQPALACDLRANAKNEDQTPTKDDLCAQCKEAIEVEAEPKDDVCDYFVKVPDPPDMGDEDEVFARNGESAAAQIPKHKSFKEKCEAVQGLMAGIISGLASGEWKEKACSCLGCCEAAPGSECYYPTVYSTVDEAHTAHKS